MKRTAPLFGSRMPRCPVPCAENHTGSPGPPGAHTSWMPCPEGTRYSCTLTSAWAAVQTVTEKASLRIAVLRYIRPSAYRQESQLSDNPAASMLDLSLQVGKYDVQKLLGKGATGTVYLARDTFTGKEVALKTIEPEVFRDPEFGTVYRSQFQNEASLAGKLRHPHIVAILDAVVGEDSGHIAMELVTGGDLSRHVAAPNLLPVADVLQIGFKCCGALEYASKEGIVHRDIKPANIMVASGTEVKIADFGAAFLRKSQVVQTQAMGSPYYMSPEQILGRPLTFHTDMYSLGVALYELLTGKKPFLAENLQALLDKIVKLEPLPPSEVRAD